MEVPRHWRLKAQRYRLEGSMCSNCGQPNFPPRPICPHCTDQIAQMSVSVITITPSQTNASEIVSGIQYERTERMP